MNNWEFSFSGPDNNFTLIRKIEANTFIEAFGKLPKKDLEKTLKLMQKKPVFRELKKEFELEISFSKTMGNKKSQTKQGVVILSLAKDSLDELVSELKSITKEKLEQALNENKNKRGSIELLKPSKPKLCVMSWKELGEKDIKKILDEKS
jgi:hypothetical protein